MIAKIFISLLLIESATPAAAFSTQRVFVSKPHRQNVKIVSDLMTQDPFTLSPSTPVDEALADLLLVGVSGAPVVERLKRQDGKVELSLVGFVSSFDFLPREEDGLVMLGEMEDSETARRILGQTVQDVMSKNPVTITNNDLMKTAAEKMARHRYVFAFDYSHSHASYEYYDLIVFFFIPRLHVLPVVDMHHGHLVGVISAKDVMRDLMNTALKVLPGEGPNNDASSNLKA
ncbi:hypothetical protein ACHAWO_004964 [Cyclotella atomus]|jgi:CBS domain-containing protein|uniref:CBS domain-containing protein n=1 Tax=Cyclotella atomus TaxID=382360 RepID=A0ABD3MSR5_9STRA